MHAMFVFSFGVAVSAEHVRVPMKQPHYSPVRAVLLFLLYQERTEAKGAHHLNLAVENVGSQLSLLSTERSRNLQKATNPLYWRHRHYESACGVHILPPDTEVM